MHIRILILLQSCVGMYCYAGVQTMTTDVATARLVKRSRGTIWEPVPPSSGYFVLGQFGHLSQNRPPPNTQLIVARSEDGSLAQPLDFYGRWQINNEVVVWTMNCPDGYVSLGAIATSSQSKPDVKRYRCVKLEAAVKANLWKSIYSSSNYSMMSIYSPYGWANVFYVVDYGNSNEIKTVAYTLRTGPVKPNEHQSDDGIVQSNKTSTSDNQSTGAPHDDTGHIYTNRSLPKLENPKIKATNGDKPQGGVKSYTILVISGGFILLVVIVFITLFCIRTNHRKSSEPSTTVSTVQTAYDSVPPSSGYASSSDTNDNGSRENCKRTRARFQSDSSKFSASFHWNAELEMKRNSQRGSDGAEREMKHNILYYNPSQLALQENEYQTINVEPIYNVVEESSPMLDRRSGIYAFAT